MQSPTKVTSGCKRSEDLSSNHRLVDWNSNVLNFVYNCLHPEPSTFKKPREVYHPKYHRRIASATTNQCFDPGFGIFDYNMSTKSKNFSNKFYYNGGHKRNVSDPCPGFDFFHRQFLAFTDPRRPVLSPHVDECMSSSLHIRHSVNNNTSSSNRSSPLPDNLVVYGSEEEEKLESGTTCLIHCLQPFAKAKGLLVCLCAMVFVQSLVASGYLSSIVTTLERRFNLTGREVGYMYCFFEVSVILTTISVSFLNGQKRNRLRIIGFCCIILGVAFCVFTLPHWLSEKYEFNADAPTTQSIYPASLCNQINATRTVNRPPPYHIKPTNESSSKFLPKYSYALPLFCFAMALAGFGSSPLYVLAPIYFWDNVSEKQYPLYSGLFYSAAALGPACGFIAGAAFLQVYVDTPSLPPDISITPYSQSWLGAWWAGMFVFGVVAWITTLPILAFPRRLPNRPKTKITLPSTNETTLKESTSTLNVTNFLARGDKPVVDEGTGIRNQTEPSENEPKTYVPVQLNVVHRYSLNTNCQSPSSSTKKMIIFSDSTEAIEFRTHRQMTINQLRTTYRQTKDHIEALQITLWRVISNPIWLGVTVITIAEQIIVCAFLIYAAKYIQALFRVPAHIASVHTGAVIVPSAVFGVLSGALLMRQFRPSIPKTLLGVMLSMLVTLVTALVLMLLLGCPENQMAGVTSTYNGKQWTNHNRIFRVSKPANLSADCNRVCLTTGQGLTSDVDGDPRFSCPFENDYNPICWQPRMLSGWEKVDDNVQMTFLNPCLAGCSSTQFIYDNQLKQSVQVFTNCNCFSNSTLMPDGVHQNPNIAGGVAKKGGCYPKCHLYSIFIVFMFMHIVLTGINQNPSNIITLSCVSSEDGTVALGLQVLLTRLLAYIPAPIYFGAMFDSVCQIRATSVDSVGSTNLVTTVGACLEYDVHRLPFVFFGGVVIFKVISIIAVFSTWRIALRRDSNVNKQPSEMEHQF